MTSLLSAVVVLVPLIAPAPPDVDFVRDVAPIFEERCTSCHGARKQRGGLRLDARAPARAGARFGTVPVIAPGDATTSELLRRVTSDRSDDRMPPKGERLSDDEVAALEAWIVQGAPWPDDAAGDPGDRAEWYDLHWAYRRPTVTTPPPSPSGWSDHPIDRFVEARLAEQGLAPSERADRPTLLRRLTLDLTGLPPTPEEIDAFVADRADDAWDRAVDRALASKHFGERWALLWLDLARYADTHGYEKDARRSMWRWRDAVIDAFDRDQPFDRFTIEQLAGDLLEDPTQDQLVATGFHRNTMINEEGGVDPEEFRVAAIVDRVNTTSAVWLGATMNCAQCHNHKFDPFTQRDYFGLYAFFDQAEESGAAPTIDAPTPELAAARARIEAERQALQATLERWTPTLAAELVLLQVSRDATVGRWRALDPTEATTENGALLTRLEDGSILSSGPLPATDTYVLRATLDVDTLAALRLDVLGDASLTPGPGRAAHGNFVLNEWTAALIEDDGTEREITFTSARADHFQTDKPWRPEHAIDGDPATGWAIGGGEGRDHCLIVATDEPVTGVAGRTLVVRLRQEYGYEHLIGRLALAVAKVRPPELDDDQPVIAADVDALLAAGNTRNEDEQRELEAWYRGVAPSLAPLRERLAALVAPPAPTVMVMRDRAEPRVTRLLRRGSFLDPGEVVTPHVPAVLGTLPPDAPADRLALARWLVSKENPLTARVTVNRLWGELFGRGIVATESDFGSQGEPPTHPALLDWLALRFVEDGWSVKRLLRTIVTSESYRQTSRVDPIRLERDPDNRFLSRGPRFRLAVEAVRDVALSAAGLLSPRIGGPSVFPPQPDGIWSAAYSGDRWITAEDDDRYRRGLYTFWRRTSPYPTFMLFDAPSRELACTRRGRSNTPLQALALLNDPAFVEAARALADRMMREGGDDPAAIATRGFRLCVGRPPEPVEIDVLLALFEDVTESTTAARDAWFVVASTLLNLDETVTKG